MFYKIAWIIFKPIITFLHFSLMQMIKKVIGILLICSSIVCVYSIECNNGNLKEGKCVCSTGYTGPDCSLRIINCFLIILNRHLSKSRVIFNISK